MAWLQTEYEMNLFDRRMLEQQHGIEKVRELVARATERELGKITSIAFSSTAEEHRPDDRQAAIFRQHFLFVPGNEWREHRKKLEHFSNRLLASGNVGFQQMGDMIQDILRNMEAVPEEMEKMLAHV